MASASYVCGLAVQALYLDDPGNQSKPRNFVLCSEMGSTCQQDGCKCRHAASAGVNGTTLYFGVCKLLKAGQTCTGSSNAGSADDYVTCDSDDIVTRATGSSTGSDNSQSVSSKAAADSDTYVKTLSSHSGSNSSGSGGLNQVQAQSSTTSAESVSTPVMITIIIVCVVFVALVSWVVKIYCSRRSRGEDKRTGRGMAFEAPSPQTTGVSSSTPPSFPFDHRVRVLDSPGEGPQDGRRGPRSNESRGRGQRGERSRSGDREPGRRGPNGERGRSGERRRNGERGRNGERNRSGDDRERGRGQRYASPRGQNAPRGRGGSPHSTNSSGRRVDISNGSHGSNGSRDRRFRRTDSRLGSPHRSNASRDQGALDIEHLTEPHRRVERKMDPPLRGPRARGYRDQDEISIRSDPRDQKPPQRQPARQNASARGAVEQGRDATIDQIALFAQQAAFMAPPPPPPRIKPQTKPIQPVKVSEPIPKHARNGPTPQRRPAPKPSSAPRRQPAPFHIDNGPMPGYTSYSPKTARSVAQSVVSSATTVVAPGRRRVTPTVQDRRPLPPVAPPSPIGYRLDSPNQSNFENKFDASFVSEAPSGMAWSAASGLSDDDYYHNGNIPVIAPPSPSEDGSHRRSVVGDYADWGDSTQHFGDSTQEWAESSQQSADMYRSTGASSTSFFSVYSDFTDPGSVQQQQEQKKKKEREF